MNKTPSWGRLNHWFDLWGWAIWLAFLAWRVIDEASRDVVAVVGIVAGIYIARATLA